MLLFDREGESVFYFNSWESRPPKGQSEKDFDQLIHHQSANSIKAIRANDDGDFYIEFDDESILTITMNPDDEGFDHFQNMFLYKVGDIGHREIRELSAFFPLIDIKK